MVSAAEDTALLAVSEDAALLLAVGVPLVRPLPEAGYLLES